MYLLDANVFIQAHRAHYGFEFVPGFWDWLDAAGANGTVLSVARVYAEITGGDEDELKQWIIARGQLFLEPDESVVEKLREVSAWAQGEEAEGRIRQVAVTEFTGGADSYLVAAAAALGFTVVTHEVSSPDSQKSIKIPDACSAQEVRCITPFAMLVEAGAKFILEP